MIGTEHFDANGPDLLEKALMEINPDIVLVEGSKPGPGDAALPRAFESKVTSYGFRNAEREVILQYFTLHGYERRIIGRYCESSGSKLVFMNDFEYENSNEIPSRQAARNMAKQVLTSIK